MLPQNVKKITYIMEYVAKAFRHESDIWSFTPNKKIKWNVDKLQLLSITTLLKPAK